MSMRNSSNAPQQNWGTPKWLFDWFDKRFHFTLDVCAEPWNAKCKKFYAEEQNGLLQPWPQRERIWCNPPYDDIAPWVAKSREVTRPNGVLLVPARTDRDWFRDCLREHEVWFLAKRLRFDAPPGFVGKVTSSGFPIIAVVFGMGTPGKTRFVDPRTEGA